MLEGNICNHFMSGTEFTFKNGIMSTHNSFCTLDEPLALSQEINVLVDHFKIKMKVYYDMLKRQVGIDHKEGMSKIII